MCLGVPARILAITDAERMLATADTRGVPRTVNIACIAEAGAPLSDCVGLWVLVHTGFAIARIDAADARLTLDLLRQLDEAAADGTIDHRSQLE